MTRSRSVATAGGLLFALVWTAFSSVFVVIGIGVAWKDSGYGWTKTLCMVDTFDIKVDREADKPFSVDLVYHYVVDGVEYTGQKVFQNDNNADDYEKLAELRNEVFQRPEPYCYVNRAHPEESVLRYNRSGFWFGLLFALFGSFFVMIGIGIGISGWKTRRSGASQLAITGAARAQAESQGMHWILIPFFGLFFLAGLGMVIGLVIPSWTTYFRTQSWEETPATVLWSRLRTQSSSDGDSYDADIFYRYAYRGDTHHSNTLRAFTGSSGTRDSNQALVDAHPSGKSIQCYVNPKKPWQATLRRDLGWWALIGLFPLPFLAIGGGGLLYALKQRRKLSANPSFTGGQSPLPFTPSRPLGSGLLPTAPSRELQPGKSRLMRCLGTFFVTLFWNGIVSVFVYQIGKDWQRGDTPWFLVLFMIPFVLVGLGLLMAALASFGALFNPVPKIILESATPRIGQNFGVRWEIAQGAGRLTRLHISLLGEEVAIYQRGTNTITERSPFFEGILADITQAERLSMGQGRVAIPAGLAATWEAKHNRIEWTLHVRGEIRFWPDIADSYVVKIHAAS